LNPALARLLCCAALLLSGAVSWGANKLPGTVTVVSAQAAETAGMLKLNAQVDLGLSKPVLSALDNGLPISFELYVEIRQLRDWWWKEPVVSLTRRMRLEYHELSRQYVIEDQNTGTQKVVSEQSAALQELGTVRDIPIARTTKLDPDTHYRARMRAEVSVDEIPLALRASGYLSDDWHMRSDWYTWSLR